MSALFSFAVPLLLLGVSVYALTQGTDVFDAMLCGAKDGLVTVKNILAPLVALLTAVSMLRAGGALDAFSLLLSPLLTRLGIPAPCAPLLLIRPVSGSGALAAASDLIERFGADSLVGRTAAVMMGATETTFYVVGVYFGAANVRKCRGAVPAALCADAAGFITAALVTRWMFGS